MSISIAVLGATGTVGQKIIALLAQNPKFSIIELVASEQRVGQLFGDVCNWREPLIPLPNDIASMRLVDASNLKADFVASCLPSDIAETVEPMLARQGKIVFSNASAFRMNTHVPLLVPEINIEHLSLIEHQSTSGKIITNPNCSAVGVALSLAPLMALGEIEHVSIVTLQSVSGAGYPGVPSLDILSNTIPHIPGEADKITEETKRILGQITAPASFSVTTHVHRVPVLYGHTVTLHITFKNNVTIEDAIRVYSECNERYTGLYKLHDKDGRPQSTKDLAHDDMCVHIGQLRQEDSKNILGLTSLTHNLVRGAAGAVITNIESYLRFQGANHKT